MLLPECRRSETDPAPTAGTTAVGLRSAGHGQVLSTVLDDRVDVAQAGWRSSPGEVRVADPSCIEGHGAGP